MSEKYDEYLTKHINAVSECYKLLTGNYLQRDYDDRICHDRSKYSEDEYKAYDEYFYPLSNENEPYKKIKFDYAWLHHIHNNPHHWQYWVLINDEEGTYPLPIPLMYIEEMVADWGSFAYQKKDGDELIKWYEANRDKQNIHPDSRKIIDAMIVVLATRINERFKNEDNQETLS